MEVQEGRKRKIRPSSPLFLRGEEGTLLGG